MNQRANIAELADLHSLGQMENVPKANGNSDTRRGDADLFRAVLVLGLVFFHTARVFDYLPNPVKNAQTSIVLMVLVGFFSQWGMPMLFFVAGFASWHSLRRRTPGEYLAQRFRRLIVPFVFGVCVLVPPERYFTLRTSPDYQEPFWQFYPKFFRVVFVPAFPRFVQPDPEVGYFDIAHLWFLYYLFIFSVLALPLFIYLKKERASTLIDRLARLGNQTGTILALAAPVVLIELFANLGESVGWNRYSFLSFLIAGYLFACDRRFERSARQSWPIALAAGFVSMTIFFWMSVRTWQAGVDPSHGFGLEQVVWRFFKGFGSWAWVVGIWGLAQKYTERPEGSRDREIAAARNPGRRHRLSQYCNEAVLPFYLLHDPVVVIVSFYVVSLNASVPAKYFLISLSSVAITILLYEALVRRVSVMRFLFGMKPWGE